MGDKDQYTMQDPTRQYPALDIPEQTQREPGLDANLQPKADHGETTYRGTGRLQGRKAVITGADSGIGRAVAIAYAREGADVVITYLPSEETDAKDAMRIMKEAGHNVYGLAGDLTSEDFCKELISFGADKMGSIDILVNNAGKQVYVPNIEDLSTDQLVSTFTVNIFAMFWLSKEVLAHMPPGGTIINTASIQAYQPSPGLLDYASTKAAIVNFTHGLGKQLAPRGIRVNAVAPGPIWTPLQPSHGQPQEKLVQFGQNTPMGRPGQPAECAPAYVFLASQESSYTTGEVIGVTGGQHLP
ncbi:MAG: Oxidoreductase [Candidatus Saccharibacteria bacterium]|jgi:NAD(P)-dependent dehydrogenase (short-subunit alcohol dehydrogenase family)|nr:Oxidoreductase [Candidatus Saccharibacteria bacterium]